MTLSRALQALALLAVAALPADAQEAALRGSEPPAALKTLPETLGDAIGLWDLSLDGSNRRCELTLSGDSGPNGRVLRFPAGCRRALPILANAAGWLFAGKGIRIVDSNVFPLIELSPRPDARSLSGTTERGETYNLVPLGTLGMLPAPEVQASETQAPSAPAPPAGPATAPAPTPTAAIAAPAGAMPDLASRREIPGSQPVLRSDVLVRSGEARPEKSLAAASPSDQGRSERPPPGIFALDRFADKDVCRIELAPRPPLGKAGSEPAKEPSRDLAPARILPGCRDGGIAVFDPVSWRFASGHLTLKAKRGHALNLVPTGDGRWRRDPEVGSTFVLRKVEP